MARKFDCEDELNEFMECPCMCDCGKWFDLDDGYRSLHSNTIICKNCHNQEIEEDE